MRSCGLWTPGQHGPDFGQDALRFEPDVLRHVPEDGETAQGGGVVPAQVPAQGLTAGIKREAIHLYDQESLDQEVDPADPGQVDLRVVANSVGAELVLGVDLHDGLGPHVQLMQRFADLAGSETRLLGYLDNPRPGPACAPAQLLAAAAPAVSPRARILGGAPGASRRHRVGVGPSPARVIL
ncbi:hypothetical protein RCH07_002859 [Arthrobacter sp. CG_A4]|nr:hypothetical protein [Arthrobacter sp. CG_A4]